MKERTFLFDKPQNVKRLLRIFYVFCGGLFLVDFFLLRHVSREWESLTGFYAIYGFAACVVLVLLAKLLRKVVMKDENFYENE